MNTPSKNLGPALSKLAASLLLVSAISVCGVERQMLPGHVPPAVAWLHPVGWLGATSRLKLTIGLPLRNRPALTIFLHQLSDPNSTQFRRYLTPGQFTEQFGPTAADYQAAISFAKNSGLTVAATHANRIVLDVEGTVADVQRTFRVNMRVYPHPTEARTFYSPDNEPAVNLDTRLLHVSGLDNYTTPHPMSLRARGPGLAADGVPRSGSGPSGQYTGMDFRTAYVPGTTLTGAGQAVGLFELSGFYPGDIAAYEAANPSLSALQPRVVLIDGFNGSPGGRRPGSLNEEVALDIEMAMSMAPELSALIVYEGSPAATTATIDDILNRMATDNLAQQLSCSWGFDIDETSQQIFLQFAAQGQSFFLASGDSGAFAEVVTQPADNPYLTVVSGTTLTTDSAQKWVSETTWSGSSGGISSVYPIPDWQQGIDMSANQGSTSMRNTPDVAMVADNILAFADNGQSVTLSGTSIAAPLWAGFTALVNQRAAALGMPPVGFLNPALYGIGKGSNYNTGFHDITTGNNSNTNSPDLFSAVPGYDLCTGWGTPNGNSLIGLLLQVPVPGLAVTPPLGFLTTGPVGGPLQMTSATYTLTNTGATSLNWTAANSVNWLQVNPGSGTLPPSGTSTVTVSLSPITTNLLISAQTATVSFTDLSTGNSQDRQFTLSIGNGGFETGDFTDWAFNGQVDFNFVDSIDASQWYGGTALPGVADSQFVHSGIYGALLGQTNSPGTLSQTLPTTAGQSYVVSFWLSNPVVGTPNEFQVLWNGTILFDQVNLGQFEWTNLLFVVSASTQSSVLQFGFRNDQNAFALDDVSVLLLPAPSFKTVQAAAGAIIFTWNTLPGVAYQLQYATNLTAAIWKDLGDPVTASNDTLTMSNKIASMPQQFYRIVQTP